MKKRKEGRMKKLLMFFLIAIFIVAFSYSQSITVTSPHSGDFWEKGKTYTITWTKSGNMNANVKIRLMQGSTKILAITDSTPNNGSYSWTVPASLSNGSYHIRVKTIDNAVYDDGEVFTIGNAPAANITVTSPHSGQKWCKGKTYTITWTKSGSMNANVKIRLMQGGTKVLSITNSTANDGSYSWKVPASLTSGNYKIRVKTIDNAVYGDSDAFSIKRLFSIIPLNFDIPITSPKSGEIYLEGNNVNIVWNNVLTKGKTVNISAADGLNHHYHLFTLTCDKTANYQMIGWRIPKGFIKEHNIKRKRYRIYIECQINSSVFKGYSDEFTIEKRSGESIELFPSCVNQVKQYYNYSECGQFIKQLTPYPTSAHNIVVAGFHGWYESYRCRNAYIYEGKAYFDLVSFRKFHKYLYNGGYRFQKATLKIRMNTNKKCPLIIHVIKNDNSDLFKVQLGDKVNHNGSKADITSIVRKWLIFPDKNKGLLFMGNDETGLYNNYNDPCVMQVQPTLTLEFKRL